MFCCCSCTPPEETFHNHSKELNNDKNSASTVSSEYISPAVAAPPCDIKPDKHVQKKSVARPRVAKSSPKKAPEKIVPEVQECSKEKEHIPVVNDNLKLRRVAEDVERDEKDVINEFYEALRDENLFAAEEALNHLERIEKNRKNFKLKSHISELEQEHVRLKSHATKDFLQRCVDDERWIFDYDQKGVQLCHKSENKNPIHTVKAHGLIEAPVDTVLEVVSDEKEMYTWFPYVVKNSADILYCEDPSRYHAVMSFHQKLPFLNLREWLTERIIHIDRKNGCAILQFTSLEQHNNPEINAVLHPPKKNVVRAQCLQGGVYAEARGQRTFICAVFNVDLQVRHIPEWILNYLAREIILKAYFNIVAKAAELMKKPRRDLHSRELSATMQHLKELVHEGKYVSVVDKGSRNSRKSSRKPTTTARMAAYYNSLQV